MYNTKLRKIYAGCALAMALTIAATPANAFAANKEVNTVAPDDANKADDPTELTGIDPTATDDTGTPDINEGYVDTDIDVWAFSENTKYSVDVEWGAMTFEYEATWNPSSHQMEGGDWKIYDSATNTKKDATQDDINKVTITNHSNAEVYAKLSYAAESAYSDTDGTFAKPTNDSDNTNATWDDTNKFYTLQTAAKADGTAGTAAVGNVYFTPNGISDAVKTSGITKWTKIGKITVAITPETPTSSTP